MPLHWFRFVWLLLMPLLPLVVTGCSSAWTAFGRASLEADVAEVVSRGLAGSPEMECQMVGTTRSGFCTFEAGGAGALAVATELGLNSGSVEPDDLSAIPPVAAEGAVGCFSPEMMERADGLPAYWIGGRPESLRLQSGGQFEYLVLLLDPDTGQACVQVSYAYG